MCDSAMTDTSRGGFWKECLFHHNCTTRREHIGPRKVDLETGKPLGKRAISYDHRLAHAIIEVICHAH
jgi:hypothetical protein